MVKGIRDLIEDVDWYKLFETRIKEKLDRLDRWHKIEVKLMDSFLADLMQIMKKHEDTKE